MKVYLLIVSYGIDNWSIAGIFSTKILAEEAIKNSRFEKKYLTIRERELNKEYD